MSILSSAKAYIKNVVGGAKIVGNAVKNVFKSPAANQSAAALDSFKPAAPVKMSDLTSNSGLTFDVPTLSGGTTQVKGGSNAAESLNLIGQHITSAPTNSPTVLNSSTDIGSSRIAADSLGSGSPDILSGNFNESNSSSFSGLSSPSTGAQTSAGNAPSTGSTTKSGYPPPPAYKDPGKLNLDGTATSLSGLYSLNPTTGQLEPVTEDTLATERKKTAEDIRSKIVKEGDVYANKDVKAAQTEVEAKKKELNNYTSELNAIVAKQTADLLKVQGVGSKEGATEAVYGGQAAEINREAAIKALPVQAQVAAAQGNLSLAQEHLTDLTKIVSENLDHTYQYKKAQFDWAAQYATGEDKIKLENLRKATDRTVAERKDAMNFAQELVIKYGDQPNVIDAVAKLLRNPNSPTLQADLLKVAGTAQPESKAGKPSMPGQTLDLGSDEKVAQTRAADLEKQGITSSDIVSLQNYLKQGYSLEQIAKMTGMPSTIQAAFSKYIREPKLGSGLE